MKSSIAAPSFKNSGFDMTEKWGETPLAFKTSRTAFSTLSAVPTGTVDLLMMTLKEVMYLAIFLLAAKTNCKSALLSESGGVPTAIN